MNSGVVGLPLLNEVAEPLARSHRALFPVRMVGPVVDCGPEASENDFGRPKLSRIHLTAGPLREPFLNVLVEAVPRTITVRRPPSPVRAAAVVMLVETLDVAGLRHCTPYSSDVACFSAQRSIHSRRM